MLFNNSKNSLKRADIAATFVLVQVQFFELGNEILKIGGLPKISPFKPFSLTITNSLL